MKCLFVFMVLSVYTEIQTAEGEMTLEELDFTK